jgi:hypothetical protein
MIHFNDFFKKFLISLTLFLIIFFSIFLFFLWIGEIGINRVVQRQLKNPDKKILFLSALNHDFFSYKAELLKQSNSEIIILGSSRAFDVRQDIFKKKIINMSGSVRGVNDLSLIRDLLFDNHSNLKLVIIYFDPWWLNKNVSFQGGANKVPYPEYLSFSSIFYSLKYLSHGNWITESFKSNNLGIGAILNEAGFSREGSLHRLKHLKDKENFYDKKFNFTFKSIENNESVLKKTLEVDQFLLEKACKVINEINNMNFKVIIIYPPFAKAVWEKISNVKGYDYISNSYDDLRNCSKNIYFYNYLKINNSLKSSDCEFVDGTHAGDVLHARIVKDISTKNDVLKDIVDSKFIESFISQEKGYAGAITKKIFLNNTEVDFLDIGCDK